MRWIGQRVTGKRTLQAYYRCDVAGADRVDFFALVGVHTDDTSDAFFFAGGGIQDVATCGQLT